VARASSDRGLQAESALDLSFRAVSGGFLGSSSQLENNTSIEQVLLHKRGICDWGVVRCKVLKVVCIIKLGIRIFPI